MVAAGDLKFPALNKRVGSIPTPGTLNELKGSECEPKRNARRACQGFSGGIAREFWDFGAQARKIFSERRRFEIPCDTNLKKNF